LRWSSEATQLAERLRDADAELVNRSFRIVDLLQAGDIRGVREEIAAFQRLARVVRQPECLWMAEMYDALLALIAGDFVYVERFGARSVEVGERLGHHNAVQTGGLYVTLACLEFGRAAHVLPSLEAYVARYPNVPWAALASFVCARAGDAAGTRRLFDRAMPIRSRTWDNLWLSTMASLCECAFFLEARDDAALLEKELAPFSGMHATIGYGAATYGAIDRYLGQLSLVLESHSDAVARLESGIDQNRAVGAHALVAHAQRELAIALRRRGGASDRRQAELLWEESARTAQRLGLTWLTDRLRESPACG
jgi:hypothetical protein